MHTFVSLLAPGITDYTACHPRNTTTYILHTCTYPYAYSGPTQVKWKNRNKEKKLEDNAKEKIAKKAQKRKRKGKEKTRPDQKRKQGKKRKKLSHSQTRRTDQRRHWAHGGYQVHRQWHWGENATCRRSPGGLTLSCDGHWQAHKFQDDDGQTQTLVSWA